MKLPDENEMIKQIMLTSTIVWRRQLVRESIEEWLSNFTGEVFDIEKERKLALWLLLNFVYYNEEEVKHLCQTLFKDYIHEVLQLNKTNGFVQSEEFQQILSSTRFFDLGRASESGGFVLYYFRQENNLPIRNFISNPRNLDSEIENIVYVDDVTLSHGSDNQAKRYLDKDSKEYNFGDKNIFLLTFVATKQSKIGLSENGYKVISCITLDERNQCFSSKSNAFHHFSNYKDDSKSFAKHYGEKVFPAHPLGWKNGQYLFGFFYNTPNNSLPIFWSEKNGWKPILKRYQKNYSAKANEKLERFV